MLPSLKSTQMGYDFAVDIVSETATEVTCKFAYSDEAGRYIERNDALSDAYIERGINVMKVQLVKAGVRLAQALNLAATTYFSAIDPKLSASEPTKPRENAFAALGGVNSDSTELAYFVDSESDDESTIQSVREPEKPTISENPKPIRREHVDHIDWNSVVLLRRATGLYVTYKHFVTSDTFVPKRALCAIVSFSEESSSRKIKFDSDLVARFGSKLSDELVIALVRKVYRLPEFDNNTDITTGKMHVKVVSNHFDTLIHYLKSTVPREGSGGVFFNLNAPYSVVAFLVKPRPTRAALVREFGERILDEPEDKINFRLLLAIKDLVVVTSPDIHLVTTEAYLKDASNRRWAFHAFFNNDDQVVFVDVRLFDFTLTPNMLKFLNRWHRLPGNEERSERGQVDHPWIIFGIQSISNGMPTASLVDTRAFWTIFESVQLVHRSGHSPIVKFTTRTHEESFKVTEAFEKK